MFGRRGATGVLAAGALALSTVVVAGPASAADRSVIRHADSSDAVAGSYIVVLRDTAALARRGVPAVAAELVDRFSGTLGYTYTAALQGFSVELGEVQARRLAGDPAVDYVEQDQRVSIAATQRPTPSWGLDRVDQQALPLSNSYTYPTTAANVHAYVIDSGIRLTHDDFGGRAVSGRDTVDNDDNATDCNGHGTHVAGTVGGSAYGVAKGVQLVAVRVLDCTGSGSTSGVVAGVDWVTANAIEPAVANMSLGGGPDSALDASVRTSISSGITYVLAAGNANANACNYSPARVAEAITVGATTRSDTRASFSNLGSCLDLFAPGEDIVSAWSTGNSSTAVLSGTSMASPHVAGAAALYLATNTGASPVQVRDRLVTTATVGRVGNPGTGSPNRLLFVQESAATFVAMPQAADFSGDGLDDLALRRGTQYFLDYDLDGGSDAGLVSGQPADAQVVGDFDGNGTDDVGLRRGSDYLLDLDLDGLIDRTVRWGRSTDVHLVGDFDGDGTDDLALRRGTQYFLDYDLDGVSDATVAWGRSTDGHFIGDFDGDGALDLALRRGTEYFLDYDLDGASDDVVRWGRDSDSHFVGDFDGDGAADLGLRRGTDYFLDENRDGAADVSPRWGRSTDGFLGRQAS